MQYSNNLTPIDIDLICELPNEYPDEFNEFCLNNTLNPPNITTGNGKALSVMLKYKDHYWNREMCDKFVRKFSIVCEVLCKVWGKVLCEVWGEVRCEGRI